MQGAREEGPADMAKVLEDSQVSGTWKISQTLVVLACCGVDGVWKTPQICVSKPAELILGPTDVILLSLAEKREASWS